MTVRRHGGVIVAGYDDSFGGRAALHQAAALARLLDAELRIVMVWREPAMFDDVATGLGELPADTAADDAERILRRASEAEFRGGVPPWVHLELLLGPAADVLIEQSSVARMLVVGRRSHSGFVGLRLGSVSARCSEHAHCPVLVVPPTTRLAEHEPEHVTAGAQRPPGSAPAP